MTEACAHRVLLLDDHPVFAQGLAHLIRTEPTLEVAGVASSCRLAWEVIRSQPIDVIVVDLSLPEGSGIDFIKAVSHDYPEMGMVVISMHEESLYGERALRAGAGGYVMKSAGGDTMIAAIHAVAAGKIWVSEVLATRLLRKVARGREGSGSALDVLSNREIEIFELIGRGQNSGEIGRSLHISKKTVESHRLNIRGKLSLGTGLELVRHAMEWFHDRAALKRERSQAR